MSAPLVISVTLLLIVLSVIIVFIAQAKERARLEAARRANALLDKYRRLKRLLSEIPPQYLANEIRLLLLDRCVETLEELKALKGKDFRYEQQIKEDREHITNIKNQTEEPRPIPVTDEEKLAETRKLLKILMKFIENQARAGNIPIPSARKHIQNTKYFIARSHADLYENRAEAAIRQDKLRIAIHNMHSAVSQLEKLSSLPEAQSAIKAYRIKIKELERIADEKSKAGVKSSEPAPVGKEWEEFLKDDEEWKKKNAYDD